MPAIAIFLGALVSAALTHKPSRPEFKFALSGRRKPTADTAKPAALKVTLQRLRLGEVNPIFRSPGDAPARIPKLVFWWSHKRSVGEMDRNLALLLGLTSGQPPVVVASLVKCRPALTKVCL
jgi:hypothetical protein